MQCCTAQWSVNALSVEAITGYLSKIRAQAGVGAEVEEERGLLEEEIENKAEVGGKRYESIYFY